MNRKNFAFLAIAALCTSPAVWATGSSSDSKSGSSDTMSGDQPGYSGEYGTEQPGTTPMGTEEQASTDQTKMKIAPHTVTIETELQSAISEVKGIKAQLQSAEAKPSKDVISHIKMHSKEVNSSLQMAATHNEHLKTQAAKLPSLAQSDEFKANESSFKSAQQQYQAWQQKMKSESYWNNKTQALADLDSLESKFKEAMSKTKDLSTKYDIQSIG